MGESSQAVVPVELVGADGAALIPSPDVSAFQLEDELVLCDEHTGQVFVLNRTGAHVWALLDGTRTGRAIAEQISEAYAIDFSTALEDVANLVIELAQAGLLRPA